jgi:hypothetical protein
MTTTMAIPDATAQPPELRPRRPGPESATDVRVAPREPGVSRILVNVAFPATQEWVSEDLVLDTPEVQEAFTKAIAAFKEWSSAE